MSASILSVFRALQSEIKGGFFTDETMRRLYATDASAYRELPAAVACPRNEEEVALLVRAALEYGFALIPRTAGTSLAGQVVGNGVVVDVSRHMRQILNIDPARRRVRVQPGVIRDNLNMALKEYGLFFAPETSTANRAMIGGMVGNNSCGANSLVYGSTRDHLLSVKGFMGDGHYRHIHALSDEAFYAKLQAGDPEGQIYRTLYNILIEPANRREIERQYPKSSIRRRNTGYALDLLLRHRPFQEDGTPFNLCTLLAGSEGTLMLMTELELNLEPLPPPHKALVCIHCESIDESLRANLLALEHRPTASELMDHYVLECTKNNIEQQQNRFFVKGDPAAILMVEISDHSEHKAIERAKQLVAHLKEAGYGYHHPIVTGDDIQKVWTLRKAGLGLLSNMPGDAKPVPVIEDTAVDVRDLPDYIREFNDILKKYGLYSVHYAHAGDGELHLRPIINLKTKEGNALFRTILEEVAALVKRYRGSLSGEHGDGRLRGEFIPFMLGEQVYAWLKEVKKAFDPQNIFNPGKIVDTPPMNTSLRFEPGQPTPDIPTLLNFDSSLGILRMAEMCNGTAECRRTHHRGGTMCPSYMATLDEKDTTRARANILREFLTHSPKSNRFAHDEIHEVMDLCLSCKGCKAECPSNVDVAKMKAEFLYQYYCEKGIPWRSRLIASIDKVMRWAALLPSLYNRLGRGALVKRLMGMAPQRSLPRLHRRTWAQYLNKRLAAGQTTASQRTVVYLFVDEFTNYHDVPAGIAMTELLLALGYEVRRVKHFPSGRACISKGLLKEAQNYARRNVEIFAPLLIEQPAVLLGVEPSAILSFRDEYPDLLSGTLQSKAKAVAEKALLLDEFLAQQMEAGAISNSAFKALDRTIWVHGHCHQKALSSLTYTRKALSLIPGLSVRFIPSGCCGMAGSFGYEKEHYDLSMKIGELVLFPAVRQAAPGDIVLASGTSCRHQIADGTGRQAMHLAEVLYEALKKSE
ncbi:MAG: oxidoreductase [Thermonema sp.]|uniref:FAD-binding and (Fe-S)-binding domain-containing protein n=1 Tax=Thermonema sp. TaxID=2231181 RepID=UPI0021DC54A8|nr:FAD-binding and (Fe-S)-binding domain-containing protein [Thermonema sp.]GIV38945.1 MAG: oxidoreductase [Thermonema sp.]